MSVNDPEGAGDARPPLWSRWDAVLAAAVALAAAVVASLFLNAYFATGSKGAFYNGEFGPAVLWTCGHGFRNLPRHAPGAQPLYDFLLQKRDRFDCGELPANPSTISPLLFQSTHRYLLLLSGGVWLVSGISWSALAWIGVVFAALAAAGSYLFMRSAVGPLLAVLLTSVWVVSPSHLAQLPHLRDYAKAPFFMLALCTVAWMVLTRASRRTTATGAAVVGAVLGLGFGMRTDVLAYVIIILVAVLCFRPEFNRRDLATRVIAMSAALLAFVIVSWPILQGYQGGDNVAHVAVLGLTDSSRQDLRLWDVPYSFGHLYNDFYVEAVINGYVERDVQLTGPIRVGTAEYAKWGDAYYGELVRTFIADTLIRAWASVIGVFDFPFRVENMLRLPWLPESVDWAFSMRRRILEGLSSIPPFAIPALAVAGIAAYSLRLAAVALFFATIVPGLIAVQFHTRHFFHLEPLVLFAYGLTLAFIWRIIRRRTGWPRDGIRPALIRVTLFSLMVAAGVVIPLQAARHQQEENVRQLLGSYETAPRIALNATPSLVAPGTVLYPVSLERSESKSRFIDTNMLAVEVGGPTCDVDLIPLTFRYAARPSLPDFTRMVSTRVPPRGASALVVSPVYTTGAKSTTGEARRFVGIEAPSDHQDCIRSIGRFAHPESFSLLLGATLLPDWRAQRLHETLRDFEPLPQDGRVADYALPAGLPPGRRWLAQVESLGSNPVFRSAQVTQVAADAITVDGRAEGVSDYILVWPDQYRVGGSTLLVTGELHQGGLTIGIQKDRQWVRHVNVHEGGSFRSLIRVDEDGRYGVVIANDVVRESHLRVELKQYGWLPPR
jgi:hypothetical protein